MEKIRVSVGTANQLGLRPSRGDMKMETAYLLTYYDGRCSANCQFCAQARESDANTDRIARGVYPEYPLEDTIKGLKDAVEEGKIKRTCIQTINRPGLMEDLTDLICQLSETGVQISLSRHPSSYKELERLKGLGVQRITIPLDTVTEDLFDKIKGKIARNPYRWEDHWSGLRRAVDVFGKDRVSTHIILGFGETEEEALDTINQLLEIGVRVGLFAFVPIKGTPLEHEPRPSVESYRRIQLGHYILKKRLSDFSGFEFEDGAIRTFGVLEEKLIEIVESGMPFVTSGCPNCNRPYSTEGPSGPAYNYAAAPSKHDIEEIKVQLGLK